MAKKRSHIGELEVFRDNYIPRLKENLAAKTPQSQHEAKINLDVLKELLTETVSEIHELRSQVPAKPLPRPGVPIGSYAIMPFLTRLASRLTGHFQVGSNQYEPGDERGEFYYLGEGYWRVLVKTEERRAYLVNPDYDPKDIGLIETAMTLLLVPEYAERERKDD